MNKAIDDSAIHRLRVAHMLLLEVSDDPALWNQRCDRANQNVNNALAHLVCVLRDLGISETLDIPKPPQRGKGT